jgi:hypothetical protein
VDYRITEMAGQYSATYPAAMTTSGWFAPV